MITRLKKIQVVILGCGRMGRRHADAYKNNPRVTIRGFYDIKKSLASSVASKYGVITYKSVNAVMSDSDVDAVSICTPNSQHYEILKLAIEYGKDSLVEKPIVTTKEHCDLLEKIMRKSKSKVMVGHTHRFYPSNIALKSLLDSGKIGTPKIINTFDYIPGRNPGQKMPNWIKNRDLSGGGVLMTDFIHTVDKISWLANSPIKKVHTHLISNFISKKDVEDAVVAIIELKNGLVATCVHGCPSPGAADMSIKVIGTKGEASMIFAGELTIVKDFISSINYPYKGNYMKHSTKAFSDEINEFVRFILENKQPRVTYKDGISAVRIILALYESFKTKQPVLIKN